MKKREIQQGSKYNMLTVVSEAEQRNGKRFFVCKCDCGAIATVYIQSLLNNKTKSCGCLRRQPKMSDPDRGLKHCYACRTLKPYEAFYPNKAKRDGLCSSCKECISRESKENYQLYGKTTRLTPQRRFSLLKREAKKRHKEVAISFEEFVETTSKPCTYCGQHTKDFDHTGIDRQDNNKDYIPGNCVPCCDKCNRFKYDLTVDEFLEHARLIAKYNNGKQ